MSADPVLVSVSVGHRRDGPKDTLRNIRASGDFCVNVVTERQLEAMNLTSGEYAPGVDEFEVAGLESGDAVSVDAPTVASCPAILECRLFREVELGGAPNTLLVGRVRRIHLHASLRFEEGTRFVDPESLRPVARLGGSTYAFLGRIVRLARPD